MDFKPSIISMRSIPRNLDPWQQFSEDLEARRGILSRPEGIRICDELHSLRYARRFAGTRGRKVTY
jgi:hypothetical protein